MSTAMMASAGALTAFRASAEIRSLRGPSEHIAVSEDQSGPVRGEAGPGRAEGNAAHNSALLPPRLPPHQENLGLRRIDSMSFIQTTAQVISPRRRAEAIRRASLQSPGEMARILIADPATNLSDIPFLGAILARHNPLSANDRRRLDGLAVRHYLQERRP